MTRCPVHDDRKASLSISPGQNGKTVLHCHAGCAATDILAAHGLTLADCYDTPVEPVPVLRSTSAHTSRAHNHTPAAIYDYTDRHGVLLAQVVRGADKTFRQRRPDGEGGWTWKGDSPRVVYRWPELSGIEPVWIVEGEKDADALVALGLTATTNRGGAGKWKQEETDALVASGVETVYVLPDNDIPGRKHATGVVASCRAAGLTATLVPLPGLQSHGDVSDWLRDGGTVDGLYGLAKAAQAAPVAVAEPEPPSVELIPTASTFVKQGEGSYRLEYPALGIVLDATQVHRDRSHDLQSELTVTTTLAGAKTVDGVLLWGSLNLSSQRTRAQMATSCAGRSGAAGLDWLGALETLALRVARAEGEGDPIRPLADYDLPDIDDEWHVLGIPILRRHPLILFGDGGAGKSLIALHIAATLAQRGVPVLYIDAEFAPEDHRERLGRLVGEEEMPRCLHYVRCTLPLVQEVGRLQKHIIQHAIQYVVFDSIAFFLPGRPEDAEHAQSYFRAVRSLGVGSLHLAHTSKSADHGEEKPFGSVFFHNSCRSSFFLKRAGDEGEQGSNVLEVSLTHKKSNTGRRLPAIGVRLTFGPDTTAVERFNVAENTELAGDLPIWQRIKALVATRPMTVDELAEELGERPASVGRAVRRMDIFSKGYDDRIRMTTALTSRGIS